MSESKDKEIAESNLHTSNTSKSIEVKDLKKHFKGKKNMEDVKAVDGISFTVEEGEFFGLLGPNGAGKTTTINMLTGLSKPTEGTATIAGFDIEKEQKKIKQLINICPQEPSMYKFLSGIANIRFFGNLHLVPKDILEKRAEEYLKLLGLYEARKRNTKGYSGGMLRQLNLIISLINDPQILFLDEPTVGMDPRARRKVWDFFGQLKEQKKTIILTSHYIEEAETLCDRVAIIDYGKLIALDSPKALIEKYEVTNLEEVFMKITGRRILEGI
ncbi:MAG: ABC transporter ATP-binding protein [Candidatus Heimdallarchaeaceae archaeon]